MENKNILIAILAVLVIFAGLQTYQIMSMKSKTNLITGNAILSNGQLDMTGWTDQEKMMYEHHGTLPARLQGSANGAQAPSSGMVGGC